MGVSTSTTSPAGGPPGPPADPAAETTAATRRRGPALSTWGGYAVLAFLILLFSVIDPERFLSLGNVRSILEISAVLWLFVAGLSLVVIGGEFDLAFGATAGLTAALSAKLMTTGGLSWPLAILVGIVIGLGIGLVAGYVVAYLRVPSFIGTLAISAVVIGLEIALTERMQFSLLSQAGFVDLARSTPILGLSFPVLLGLLVTVIIGLVSRSTVFGRQLTAVGGNGEAAEIAGVPVARRLLVAFAISGTTAGVAGILLIGQAAAYVPESTGGYLIPALTGVFAGLAFHPRNQFSVAGSAIGVLLMSVLTNGLIVTQQPSWAVNVVQGIILIIAVRVSLRRRLG